MLWFERPPLSRWLAGAILVTVAAWSEFAPPPTAAVPFLAVDVPAGTHIQEQHLTYREVPAGTFPVAGLDEMVAATDLSAGDPLVPSLVTEVDIPDGWLLIEAPVPDHAPPGTVAVAIVLGEGGLPREIPARVVARGATDAFGDSQGTIAVPAAAVAEAAAAAADGRLVVGVGADSE